MYPMCKKDKGDLMPNSDAMSILNCAFDCPCFFTHGVGKLFVQDSKSSECHRLRIQACFVLKVAFLELCTPANEGKRPGDFGSRAEINVCACPERWLHVRHTSTLEFWSQCSI